MGRDRGNRNRGGGGHRGEGRGYGRGEGGRDRDGGRGRGRRQRRGRGFKSSTESGNKRERIAVESGHLVLIDQFMLANPQLIEKLETVIDRDPAEKDEIIREYGGVVASLPPGTYRIERDPFALSIIVHPEGYSPNPEGLHERATEGLGHVFVDTRCLAMVDRELLDDGSLLEKYQQLWNTGQDKACRDLLRDNGGAVRYGFGRYGDELAVYFEPEDGVLCLWPDVVEQPAANA